MTENNRKVEDIVLQYRPKSCDNLHSSVASEWTALYDFMLRVVKLPLGCFLRRNTRWLKTSSHKLGSWMLTHLFSFTISICCVFLFFVFSSSDASLQSLSVSFAACQSLGPMSGLKYPCYLNLPSLSFGFFQLPISNLMLSLSLQHDNVHPAT